MATVSSFEDLEHPSKPELRQFAELFSPLFDASSPEARRQAVAALARSRHVPSAVAFFIGCQPIAISAAFLSQSPSLSDEALITIARTQGADHARAIVRRDQLSPAVIDALVGLRQSRDLSRPPRPVAEEAGVAEASSDALAMPQNAPDLTEQARFHSDARLSREEALRNTIKQMAQSQSAHTAERLGLRTVTPVQEALLTRFARAREADAFATTLSDTLSASRWLSERIMLDISGHQLATTLKGIGMEQTDSLAILEQLYGHLREKVGGVTRSAILWDQLDENECGRRVEAWRRADRYTYADQTAATPAARPARSA
ncbi:DUF2336 domain-containing protein [Rhizobium sp. SSA_523]|uniref:DUF2336 domain-containing protein n=1 Tax=Rhizobium sp. SSA_523 TaxID=2952477 RepID=UPI002091DA3C|nr:DUF2336 domain-containing protein [Rhizobium sp. SSA_523]MCO5730952.1 DUF2336 domain-containing protein [Rhizobium sp. SSA_523]WKC24239.1 DUF2336 domain-containing protein [Rhizobium sp. SSA_523]